MPRGPADQPQPITVRPIVRRRPNSPAADPVGFVRSGQIFDQVRRKLAAGLEMERHVAGAGGFDLVVHGYHQGNTYTAIASHVVDLNEAFFKLSHYEPRDARDWFEITDEAGVVLQLPVTELRLSPQLERLRQDGVRGLGFWCGRCPRRGRYGLEALIGRLGGSMTVELALGRWIARCDRHRAAQYRQCRPRADLIEGPSGS